jgi:hypothetical protein
MEYKELTHKIIGYAMKVTVLWAMVFRRAYSRMLRV